MQKQELLSILITFVVGFFAGGFLYLNIFTQMVQPDNLETKEEIEQFEITSRVYGGCRSNCPAFQVSNDGTYRYQYTPAVGGEAVLRNGTLPLDLQRKLSKEIKENAISGQATPVQGINCASSNNGVDISYTVTLSGNTYVLDSCKTAVVGNSDAWLALSAVWTYFTEISN